MDLDFEAELMKDGKRNEILSLFESLKEKIINCESIPELIRIQTELKQVKEILLSFKK